MHVQPPASPRLSPTPHAGKLTMVAVMKKFHGRRVAKPMMKKIIHTALYLWQRVETEKVDATGFHLAH